MKAIQKVFKKYLQFFYCLQEVQYSLKRAGSIEPCEMTFFIHCLGHTKLRRSEQHGCSTFNLHQRRTEACGSFLVGRSC